MTNDELLAASQHLSEFFGDDELDPELADCIEINEMGFTSIKHPLVFSIMHTPMLNRMMNQMLASKREVIAEYEAEQDWHGYILAHERPYRLDALLDLDGRVSDAEWWELVAFVWCDSENIRQFPDVWNVILRSDRPERWAMMRDDEREDFDALPELIVVYQGCTDERDDGWSWTTNREKAAWFGRRFAMMEDAKPRLRRGEVRKSDVTAFLTRRNESEVLVAPELVTELWL